MMFYLRENLKESAHQVGCPTCHGKGIRLIVTAKIEPCISCKGTGYNHDVRCFMCCGTGTQAVAHSEVNDCKSCEGSGLIRDRQTAYAG